MDSLGNWSDNHLEPEEGIIVGTDWRGNELYGNEFGYMTEHRFIPEEDAMVYLYKGCGLPASGDGMGGGFILLEIVLTGDRDINLVVYVILLTRIEYLRRRI